MIKRQQGQTLTEYAIIIGFIAMVVIAALILFGGGIGGIFQRTSDALGDGEPTSTPGPTPTPDAYTFSCSSEFALSKQNSVQFDCKMDPGILKLEEVERIDLSVTPGLPDFHVAMFKFPSLKETRFYCGPGGCRGFSGSTSYLYPFEDTSDTLPDEWTSSAQLNQWLREVISGHVNYYRLKGDGTKPGAWGLTKPEEPWAGTLNITVIGRPAGAEKTQ